MRIDLVGRCLAPAVGALGLCYATWGGKSVHNIGKVAIHGLFGGKIAGSAFEATLELKEDSSNRVKIISTLAIEVIAYLGTLYLYKLLSPELSLPRAFTALLIGCCAYKSLKYIDAHIDPQHAAIPTPIGPLPFNYVKKSVDSLLWSSASLAVSASVCIAASFSNIPKRI